MCRINKRDQLRADFAPVGEDAQDIALAAAGWPCNLLPGLKARLRAFLSPHQSRKTLISLGEAHRGLFFLFFFVCFSFLWTGRHESSTSKSWAVILRIAKSMDYKVHEYVLYHSMYSPCMSMYDVYLVCVPQGSKGVHG